MDDPSLQKKYIRATSVIHKQPGAPHGIYIFNIIIDTDFTKMLLDSLYSNGYLKLLLLGDKLSDVVAIIDLIKKHGIPCLQAPLLERSVESNRVFTTYCQNFRESITLGKLIKSTQVIQNKDPKNWNWDTILDTFQYALMKVDNINELHNTKFMKRITEFMLPISEENDNLLSLPWSITLSPKITLAIILWTKVCSSTSEGINILKDNKYGNLLDVIYKDLHALLEVVITDTSAEVSQLFTPANLQRSMVRQYITIIATLLNTESGTNVLKETKILDILQSMTRSPRFDYIARLLLPKLYYSDNEVSRELIKGWCTFGTKSLRLFIMGILRTAVRNGVFYIIIYRVVIFIYGVYH